MAQAKSEEEGYVKVCSVEEVPEYIPRRVEVQGCSVLLCRDQGQIYAVDERCPHKDRSMRYAVILDGELICPHHQYHFELKTGRCRTRCAPVRTYDVRVVEGQVWVRI